MSKKWSARHDVESDEMPSLTNSITSRVSRVDYDELSLGHEHRPYYSSDEDDDEEDKSILRPRTKSVQRTIRPALASRATSVDRRASSRRRRRRNRRRFSYSRCASLGGTTRYSAPHMAALDTCLRSTCGLRLRTDGTCDFLFERQRFAIESSADDGGTGDFLFYANLGPLGELQRRNKPRNLLRLLAAWNEELKRRRDGGGTGPAGDGGREESGLLRIDSSKPDGPHVAFIYYGRVEEIEDAPRFQETLDEFVDDALEFSDRVHGIKEREYAEKAAAPPFDARGPRQQAPSNVTPDSSASNGRPKFNRDAAAANDDDYKQPQQKEAATLAAVPSAVNSAITTSDIYHATSRKSVFTKMIQSIRAKAGSDNNTGPLAFVDPSNPVCAFVVDRSAAEEGNIKPAIVLNRKGSERGGWEDVGPPARKGSSFHDRGVDGGRDRRREKGESFHASDDGDRDGRPRGRRGPPSPPSRRADRERGTRPAEGSDYERSGGGSDYERSGGGVDAFDRSGGRRRSGPARFRRSEPVASRRRPDVGDDRPEPSAARRRSRRRPPSGGRRRHEGRGTNDDGERRRGRRVSTHRRSANGRMSLSDPVMSRRRESPPPTFS